MSVLNQDLLKSQEVTQDQINKLDNLYILLEELFTLAKNIQNQKSLDYTTGSVISNTLRDIEFMLQKNWNFNQNEDYHKYWFRLPGCTCPVMDNEERVGTPYGIITQDCPYHGKEQ